MRLADLRQEWPRPRSFRPIIIIGAGGVVNDAHLPAYRKAAFPIAGLYDKDRSRAEALARNWGVARVYETLEDAAAERDVIFDVATPPAAHLGVLRALPAGAGVLIQKPMGRDLSEASEILTLCRQREFKAAVNFQLRFSSMMLAVRDAIRRGLLGEILDIEVHLNLVTPWHLFPFLKGAPRVEILLHSIHYFDLIQSLIGSPTAVFARTYGHPSNDLAQTRTSAILDHGRDLRVTLSVNHNHDFGRRFQDATFRFEGDQGSAIVKLGLLLNYPEGEPDELWIARKGSEPEQVPLSGLWFPDAFVGVMSNLQRFVAGDDETLESGVESAWVTMAIVEACYRSDANHRSIAVEAWRWIYDE